MTKPRPGSDGDLLPAGTLVFRIGKRADPSPEALKQKKPPEILFKPSSDDEESPGKRLSIWVEELTLPDQGWAFMGCDPAKTMVACLNVDAIRAIQPPEPLIRSVPSGSKPCCQMAASITCLEPKAMRGSRDCHKAAMARWTANAGRR